MAWLRRIGLGLGIALLAWAAIPAWQLGRFVIDDQALDHVVVAVALDWRDFGEDKARDRLGWELDHRALSSRLPEGACGMVSEVEAGRSVACSWSVEVELPGLGRWPLAFGSVARIDAQGVLEH